MPSTTEIGNAEARSYSGTCYDSCDEEDFYLGLTRKYESQDQDTSIHASTEKCCQCGGAVGSLPLVPCVQRVICEACVQREGSPCQCPICTQTKSGLVLRMIVKSWPKTFTKEENSKLFTWASTHCQRRTGDKNEYMELKQDTIFNLCF